MKLTKILLSTLSGGTLALTLSGCNNAVNNNVTANNAANKSNMATVVNSNQTAVNNPTPVSNMKTANDGKTSTNDNKTSTAATPAGDSESENVSGELMVGKTDSVILYVGEETGDYAAYCFLNNSEAGRAILAKCKDKEQCEVEATLGDGPACEVPGLEATLSAEFRIVSVSSIKSLGRRK